MTNREFYQAIVNGNITDEVIAHANDAIVALDTTNEKRRAKAAEKAVEKEAERAPIREAILNAMTSEPMTATSLIEAAGVEVKPQAIPSLLKGLVEAGVVVKSDIKVKGKGTQKGYARA